MSIRYDAGWVTPVSMDKYYVYAYFDETGLPFYIGKGKGYRVNNHVKPSLLSEKSYKNHKIRRILALQGYVKRDILSYFDNEEDAYIFEEFLIGHYGLKSSGGLLVNQLRSRFDISKKMHSPYVRKLVSKKVAKLSDERVIQLFADYEGGTTTQAELSEKYNVSSTTVSALLCGKVRSFDHIPRSHVKKYNPTLEDPLLIFQIIQEKLSGTPVKDILRKYSISRTSLYRLIKKTAGEGTSTSVAGQDESVDNLENS